MRQIAGPHLRPRITTRQHHTHTNLALLHHPLPVFFTVIRIATTLLRHPDIIQIQINLAHIQIRHTGITNRREYAT